MRQILEAFAPLSDRFQIYSLVPTVLNSLALRQLVGPDLMTFVMGLANEEVIYVNSNFTDLGRASSREDPNYLRILFILQRASLSGGGRPTEEWQKRQMFRLDGAESETSKQWLVDLKADVHRVVDSRPVTRRSKIAILDTGIDWGHPAFRELVDAGRIIPKSFIEGLPADQDSSGHGTHAAHVLLQVAPNSKLFIARVIEDGSQAEFDRNISAIVEAIKWAVSQGVDIISMSFGYRVANAEIKAAIRDAFHKGVILLAAASNSGANPRFPISFPASMRQVICVHSSDGNGNPSTLNPPATPDCNFTILGEHVAAAWPRRLYTERTDNLRVASGTSIATPIAAGFAALILEYAAQNGPENEVVTRWMQLRHCDEMRKVFGALARERSGYRSIAPSSLFDYHGEEMHQRVSARINDILDSL
ncbi:Peptidase S8/S53 domain containing protein [Rhypophila sp. PSN 637]